MTACQSRADVVLGGGHRVTWLGCLFWRTDDGVCAQGRHTPPLPSCGTDAAGAVPKLDCPSCGVPLVPAHSRGAYDRDGNYVQHSETCRCSNCRWMWFDDAEAVACACGARVLVEVDDENAFTTDLTDPDPKELS